MRWFLRDMSGFENEALIQYKQVEGIFVRLFMMKQISINLIKPATNAD